MLNVFKLRKEYFYEMLKYGIKDFLIKYIEKENIINYTYKDLINQICSLHNYYQLNNIKTKI